MAESVEWLCSTCPGSHTHTGDAFRRKARCERSWAKRSDRVSLQCCNRVEAAVDSHQCLKGDRDMGPVTNGPNAQALKKPINKAISGVITAVLLLKLTFQKTFPSAKHCSAAIRVLPCEFNGFRTNNIPP